MYELAAAGAIAGRRDEAFLNLGLAVEDGLIAPGQIAADPDLRSLRDDSRFGAVVAKARETSTPDAKPK